MPNKLILLGVILLSSTMPAPASAKQLAQEIDQYVTPYVDSANFSGVVLVREGGRTVFEKAYGYSDRERKLRNSKKTRFHVASVSMQFTAAAVLRLADQNKIDLDKSVSTYLPEVHGVEKITVRQLLLQRSGIPDINARSDYGEVLKQHQTPGTLVAKVAGEPLLFEPGSQYMHEEHSAFNLLAMLLERQTGLDFRQAEEKLVFAPAGMKSSGVDDDTLQREHQMAIGYAPAGVSELQPAQPIHWSGKAGNGSAYATAEDEARFVAQLFSGKLLDKRTLTLELETDPRVGYGWFRNLNSRFKTAAYYMNGRAPGFASFVLWIPSARLTVVVLSNIYSSATSDVGYDLAAIALGQKYTRLHPLPSIVCKQPCAGTFQFAADFYQPNAALILSTGASGANLQWPSGEKTSLIPVGPDEFVDRAYWQAVKIERDAGGRPVALIYDRFRGAMQQE